MQKAFFCLRVKTATLFIGLCDLFSHMLVLFALCTIITRPTLFNYYTRQNIQDLRSAQIAPSGDSQADRSYANSAFFAPSDDVSRGSLNTYIANGKYPQNEYMINNYSAMFNRQNNMLVFMVTLCSSLSTLMLIYGVLKNRASYLMPFFCIKVFQVVVTSLSALGFYSCLPNVKLYLASSNRTNPSPLNTFLLSLDKQTLDLLLFTFLLVVVLIKVYLVVVVWRCYRYMITSDSFRYSSTQRFFNATEESFIKMDDDGLLAPPKYEDVILHKGSNVSPPPYSAYTTSPAPTATASTIEGAGTSTISSIEPRNAVQLV